MHRVMKLANFPPTTIIAHTTEALNLYIAMKYNNIMLYNFTFHIIILRLIFHKIPFAFI